MRQISAAVLIPIGCAVFTTVAHAQFGRGNSDWNTAGFDPQRSNWVRTDPKISKESLSKPGFAMTWKIGLAKESKSATLGPPILLNRYIGYRGFRSFAFIGGAGDNVYTVDTDLSRLEWHDQLAAASAPPPGCGTPGIPMVARPSSVAFPAPPPAGRGGGGRGGPAHSAVGQPGDGAVTVAQLAAAANMMGGPGRGGRGPGGFDMNAARRSQNSLYVLAADGNLHTVFLASGEKAEDPVKFLPPGSGARGFVVIDNVAYAATPGGCGGTSGVYALNLTSREVSSWTAKGTVAGAEGPAFGPDGTVYVANAGSSPAITALEPKTLQRKDWYASGGQEPASSPVIFQYKERALLAVSSKDRKIILLDTKSLGGGDHQTPVLAAPVEAAPESLASWQDSGGTRWLLGNTEGAIRAWKLVERDGAPALEAAWVSPEIASPAAPIIVNGVVFAASKGSRRSPAVLYALDSATGKEFWNSGKTISSLVGESGLSAGDTQVYVGTADGTLYAFGFPIEH